MRAPDRRTVFAGAAVLAAAPAAAARPDLFRSASVETIRAALRALIAADTLATFATVDAQGFPRARTVLVGPPDDDLTFWIGTRQGSRKLAQIARDPRATLHLADDAGGSYASLTGRARIERDPTLRETKSVYQGDARDRYFPNFPTDFALILFTPEWVEVTTPEMPGRTDTWQPEGMAL